MTLRKIGNCCVCNTEMAIPYELYEAARASEKISFYCSYGHEQAFSRGPTKVDIERSRAQRAEQENARLREERDAAQRSASALKGQITKIKKRVDSGVCPCCNRHFTNLERHMKTKHGEKS